MAPAKQGGKRATVDLPAQDAVWGWEVRWWARAYYVKGMGTGQGWLRLLSGQVKSRGQTGWMESE